jgi:hypothetical protein
MWTFGHLQEGEVFYVETYGEHNNYMAPYVAFVKISHVGEKDSGINCKVFGSQGQCLPWACPDHAKVVPGPVPIDKIYA